MEADSLHEVENITIWDFSHILINDYAWIRARNYLRQIGWSQQDIDKVLRHEYGDERFEVIDALFSGLI